MPHNSNSVAKKSVASPSIISISPDTNIIGDGVTDSAILAIGGTAAANSVVSLFDGGLLIGTAAVNASGIWTFAINHLSDGVHSFYATDSISGVVSAGSAVALVTVDTVAPSAPFITSGHTTGHDQVSLSGTAEAGSVVTIFDGAAKIGTVTASVSGVWSYTSGQLTAGAQIFSATAMDQAGNVSLASQSISVGVEVGASSSTSAPVQAFLQNYTQLTFDDEFNSSSSIDISNSHAAGYDWYVQHWFTNQEATSADNISVSNGILKLGGGAGDAELVSAFATSSGTINGTVIGNGAYLEASIKYDPSIGSSSGTIPAFWGEAIQHIIDPNAVGAQQWLGQPSGYAHFAEVDFMEAGNSSGYLGTMHDWSGTYSSGSGWEYNVANTHNSFIDLGTVDWSVFHTYGLLWVPQSGSTPGHVTWYFDGQAKSTIYWLGPATTTSLPGLTSSLTPSSIDLATATYSILDNQQLALSLTTDSNWPMYVDWVRVWQASSAVAAVATPIITSFSPDGGIVGDGITNSTAIVLTGTAAANSVELIYDGTNWLGTAAADANGAWHFSLAGLVDGAHAFVAASTDVSGNTSALSAILSVTVDTTKPTGSITSEVYTGGQLTLAGVSSEAGDTIAIYDSSNLIASTTSASGGAWSFTSGNIADAIHRYQIAISDRAGNTNSGLTDALLGSSGSDTLVGTSKAEIIVGNGGNDTFVGGGGSDTLFAGSGKDIFVFKSSTDSTWINPVSIAQFNAAQDTILFSGISGIAIAGSYAKFQGQLSATGAVSLQAHSVGYFEAGGNTTVVVNTTAAAETISAQDAHGADMTIVLLGTHLGLSNSDFHVV